MGLPMPEITNPAAPLARHPALQGLTVLQRGWLSSNNVLLHGQGAGAVLVDSGHLLHAPQTVALVRQALAGEALAGIVNTHLHSDHCGGNASCRPRWAGASRCRSAPWDAASTWDEDRLSYRHTGPALPALCPDARCHPAKAWRGGRAVAGTGGTGPRPGLGAAV
jgi:glyoxylase-like metal-dependent hydrolase (beta-lactamase superfamily II)